MKNRFLLFIICCLHTSLLHSMPDTDKLQIEVTISNSYFDKISRYFSINNTVINVEFSNLTDSDIGMQKPICNWNLFITIVDTNDRVINTSLFEFINPVIDSSSYTTLKSSEKKIYKFRFSDLGDFKGSFSELKKITLEYIPQKAVDNENYKSVILEKYITELKLTH